MIDWSKFSQHEWVDDCSSCIQLEGLTRPHMVYRKEEGSTVAIARPDLNSRHCRKCGMDIEKSLIRPQGRPEWACAIRSLSRCIRCKKIGMIEFDSRSDVCTWCNHSFETTARFSSASKALEAIEASDAGLPWKHLGDTAPDKKKN